jgi:uncharacterized protein
MALPRSIEVESLNHPDMIGYAEGLQAGEIRVQQCGSCGFKQWPPRPICANCLESNLSWTQLPGEGRIFTFTISRSSSLAAYKESVPYVIAIIELAGGIRMLGHVDNEDPESLSIGDEVKVEFAEVSNTNLPYWVSKKKDT